MTLPPPPAPLLRNPFCPFAFPRDIRNIQALLAVTSSHDDFTVFVSYAGQSLWSELTQTLQESDGKENNINMMVDVGVDPKDSTTVSSSVKDLLARRVDANLPTTLFIPEAVYTSTNDDSDDENIDNACRHCRARQSQGGAKLEVGGIESIGWKGRIERGRKRWTCVGLLAVKTLMQASS